MIEAVRIWLGDGARMPTRAHPGDAGLDLYAPADDPHGESYGWLLAGAGDPRVIDTRVHVEIPHGYAGHVLPRSSLSMRGVHVCHGVIDAGYRGPIGVCVWSPCPLVIEPGERIAQLVIAPVWTGTPVQVASLDGLSATERGAGGFGSTGSR